MIAWDALNEQYCMQTQICVLGIGSLGYWNLSFNYVMSTHFEQNLLLFIYYNYYINILIIDDIIMMLQSRWWTMTEANILYCSVSVRYRVMNNSSKSFFRWIISEIFCCWKQQNELSENLGKTCRGNTF